MEQQTNEWYIARDGKITCSKFSALTPKGKGGAPFGKTGITYALQNIAEILTGQRKEVSAPSLTWGNTYEPDAKALYMSTTFHKVTDVGYLAYDEWIGGSPDGLLDKNGLLEIKCPLNSDVHLYTIYTNEVPDEYKPQLNGYFWLTGALWADFVSYDCRMPEEQRLHVIRVPRDEAAIQALKERVLEFKTMQLDMLRFFTPEAVEVIDFDQHLEDIKKLGEAATKLGATVDETLDTVNAIKDAGKPSLL